MSKDKQTKDPENKRRQTPPSPKKRGYCWLTGWNFTDTWHRNSTPTVPETKINLR